jgi:hypothetical protein
MNLEPRPTFWEGERTYKSHGEPRLIAVHSCSWPWLLPDPLVPPPLEPPPPPPRRSVLIWIVLEMWAINSIQQPITLLQLWVPVSIQEDSTTISLTQAQVMPPTEQAPVTNYM